MKWVIAEFLLWSGASFLAVLAVLFGLMLDNIETVRVGDLVRPMAVLLPVCLALTLLLISVRQPLVRILPAAIYLYFNFYQINNFILGFKDILPLSLLVLSIFALYPLCLLAIYRLLQSIEGYRAAIYTSVVTGAMASATFVVILPSLFYKPPPSINLYFEKESLAAVSGGQNPTSNLPDIIYVVPDRYASNSTLRAEYSFKNEAFYQELQKRGFIVFEDSWANYPRTFQSMASTFNSGYLGQFTELYGTNSSNMHPVHRTIEDNVVQARLRQLGYEFHNYGGYWEPTRINRWADVNDQGYPQNSYRGLPEFERVLLRKTPLILITQLFSDGEDQSECKRIKQKLKRLRVVGNGPRPVFVLAHIFIPHDPIVIDADGRCLDRWIFYRNEETATWGGLDLKAVPWDDYKEAYVEYLKYFNNTILDIFDAQLNRRGTTGRKLVFVIQADEGPYPKSLWDAMHKYDIGRFSRQELRMKLGIINALRLPEGAKYDIPPLQTPVNNWRIIFSALTGHKMDLLPDKIFVYPRNRRIFDFCEVTDILVKQDAAFPSCMK